MEPTKLLAGLLVTSLLCFFVDGKSYKPEEKITMYVNKVGPFFNPQETYPYFSLPVCRPKTVSFRELNLGQLLIGDRMAVSPYEVHFGKDTPETALCTLTPTGEELSRLRSAVEDLYYFEFVLDDIRLRGFLGRMEEHMFPHRHFLYFWTHHHFTVLKNGDKVIYASVNTTTQPAVRIDELNTGGELKIPFTYSLSWADTSTKYKNRDELTKRTKFFHDNVEIHWLSIFNSLLLTVMLMAFMAFILMRVLNNDMARYNSNNPEEDMEDLGWKVLHGDVFRFPAHKSFLCALLGCGTQFLTLAVGIVVMACFDLFNIHNHGSMATAGVFLYAMTCCISGYVSSRFFRMLDGHRWAWNIILTSSLFSLPFFIVWSVINSVAWYNQSTQALPFTTIFLLMLVWLFIGFPLTVIGGITGRNHADVFNPPCRTKNIPREIPPLSFLHRLPVRMLIGGFLPFSSVSVELYYVFSTMWGRQVYTLYGILLLVFVILVSMTVCLSVVQTYFQLRGGDYRWWWQSIVSAGSTGFFVFAYAVFYFYWRSQMSGTLQTVQYFGYAVLICYVFFLTQGTISFFSSLFFTRYIYSRLRMD
eukprot:scpid61340/ scgid18742/ Transmembrane 9 superfamily member 1